MGTWSHWAYFSVFPPPGFIVWIPARPWVIPRQVLSLEKHLQSFQQESPRDGPSIGFPSILLIPARKLLFHDYKISHLIDGIDAPRMPPLCRIAAPQKTFVKFLKGQGNSPLPPDAFCILNFEFIQKPWLVVIYLCSEKPQSSTPALQFLCFHFILECGTFVACPSFSVVNRTCSFWCLTLLWPLGFLYI